MTKRSKARAKAHKSDTTPADTTIAGSTFTTPVDPVVRYVRQRATACRQFADRLGDEGPAAMLAAITYEGTLGAASGGGGASPAFSDPAGDEAVRRHDDGHDDQLAGAADRIRINLRVIAHAELQVLRDLDRCRTISVPIADKDRHDIKVLNTVEGECQVCEAVRTLGTGEDRLRAITITVGHVVLMCNACRMAWSRTDDVPYPTFKNRRMAISAVRNSGA